MACKYVYNIERQKGEEKLREIGFLNMACISGVWPLSVGKKKKIYFKLKVSPDFFFLNI